MAVSTRWLFADQLGPHFYSHPELDADVGHIVIIESTRVFSRRRYHRAKAHLVLSAIRHFVNDVDIPITHVVAPTYRDAWSIVHPSIKRAITVVNPTSYAARDLVTRLGNDGLNITVLPSRGFVSTENEFSVWAASRGKRRLLLEDFYRDARRRTGVMMDGEDPVTGHWNFDAENRLSPPRGQATLGVTEPWWPAENHIDHDVRKYLDELQTTGIEFKGVDSPRAFAVTRAEALTALNWFIEHRLASFGPYEDAAMKDDWTMSHSLLSVPLNLGLLDPREVVEAAEAAYRAGAVPIASAEGFIRQIMGWRDYVWHLYWHLGRDYIGKSNHLQAHHDVPDWWSELKWEDVDAQCLKVSLRDIERHGWTHHIPRLMILGNWALQRGFSPQQTTEWFLESFVDGYEWVMAANVVGMALYADGGVMATKPYAGGGAYIKRMTDFCGGCKYRPDIRVGDKACPVTAGYWNFLATHQERFRGNHRLAQPLNGLKRLADLPEVLEQEKRRGLAAP